MGRWKILSESHEHHPETAQALFGKTVLMAQLCNDKNMKSTRRCHFVTNSKVFSAYLPVCYALLF
jgi:hypothetical protein